MLQALAGGTADERGDGAPLGRVQFGKVQQALLLLPAPLRLLDAGVQPLVPTRFALSYVTNTHQKPGQAKGHATGGRKHNARGE